MLSTEMKSPPRKSGNENFDISPLPSASPKRTALPRPGRRGEVDERDEAAQRRGAQHEGVGPPMVEGPAEVGVQAEKQRAGGREPLRARGSLDG